MTKAVMLLTNPFRPDPRVLKEALSLQKAGHQIQVICWDRQAELPSEESLAGVVKISRIQSVPSSYGIGPAQLLKLPGFWASIKPYLVQTRPDLIHCHDFDTLPAGLWYGSRSHIPVIYDAHEYYADLVKPRLHGWTGWLLYQAIKLAEHLFARKVQAVITVDDILGRIYRQLNRRVLILGHYPLQSMAATANPVFTRNRLTMLYAGRISEDRGMLLYLDILRHLLSEGIPARLLLAGVFTPDSEQAIFTRHSAGIENAIEFRGWVAYEQMGAIYHEADVGLSILQPEPRYVAALPVKMFEYMANGLPVVASNFPAVTDVIQPAGCGELVDPLADPARIAGLLTEWWHNPQLPRRLGENGRQAVLKDYNWENQVQALVELYRAITD